MSAEYFPILMLAVLALGLAGVVLLLSHLLGPRRPVPGRGAPAESGMVPRGDARLRFPVKFYAAAMVFVIFDVGIAFLYSWAVVFRDLLEESSRVFFAVLPFLGVLLVGLVYAWRKGVFEWE